MGQQEIPMTTLQSYECRTKRKASSVQCNCARRVLVQTARTRGGILEVENFAVAIKNHDFSRTGLARYCREVRKGLPKLRWGSKKHSEESGSEVFARDSEVEREELCLNEKK